MIITETKELKKLCRQWLKEPFITVDTEFLRERTYYSKVCLIQIGSGKGAWCVDPLAVGIDLTPLFEVMRAPKVLKVFHASFQDLEIFYHLMHEVPAPVFDTQIAAMMCGFTYQIGYADLVYALTGQNVDKGMRFTDWSQRPLTEQQQQYALGDVTHLVPVYLALTEKLKASGRFEWLEDEWKRLESPSLYQVLPQEVWKKHRPPSKKPALVGVYAHLLAWREEMAQKLDKPRRLILSDEIIDALTLGHPTTPEDLSLLRGMKGLKEEYQTQLLHVIGQALKEDGKGFESEEEILTPTQKNLVHLLGVLLGCQAEEVGIAESLIADKEKLKAFVLSPTRRVFKGWRQEVFGRKALSFIKGQLSLSWDGEKGCCQFNQRGQDADKKTKKDA